MAGTHISYIPEICYLYNRGHSNQDDSTKAKREKRLNAYKIVIKRKGVEKVKSLFTA